MLAYLFERFPSFTQTFCVREVTGLRARGRDVPVFSIRSCDAEAVKSFPAELYQSTRCLPQDLEAATKRWLTPFAWRARKARRRLVAEWGSGGDRARAHEAAWLAPRLRTLGVEHVHTHFAGRAARTAYWLKELHGFSYSFTAHANDFFVDQEGARLNELFREARFVVTVSDFSAAQLRERFRFAADRIIRVYNGIDCSLYAGEAQPVTPPMLLSVGRYIEKKGYADLIDACAKLEEREFTCRLVGGGPLDGMMRERIERLGLQDRVFVDGPKSESEIRTMLLQARGFVLACKEEADGGMDNLPTVIMEAMAAGLPVVSTRLAGVPEMVVPDRTGLLVPPEDPAALAGALGVLLDDPQAAARMGRAGAQLARERFDLAVTIRNLIDVFERHDV